MSTDHIGERTAGEATELTLTTAAGRDRIGGDDVRPLLLGRSRLPPQRPQRPRHRLHASSACSPRAPGSRSTASAPARPIAGPYGTSNIWDNIDNGEYVSDAYVLTGSDGYVAARCS